MIVFILGTTAELIKTAPTMRELQDRSMPYELWYTGMHTNVTAQTWTDLGVFEPTLWLANNKNTTNVVSSSGAVRWVGVLLKAAMKDRKKLKTRLNKGRTRATIVVHGDTLTTVYGAFLGKWLKVPVVHIEAGCRSWSLRNPFPEEIDRRVVTKLATVHIAPGPDHARNLKKARGKVVVLPANTVADSTAYALDKEANLPDSLPPVYGIVTLHRLELISNKELYSATLAAIVKASKQVPVVMPVGEHERARLEQFNLLDSIPSSVVLVDKLPYTSFMHLLDKAEFVITDSGGLQEEAALLGVPCLVHRAANEYSTGPGTGRELSGLDVVKVSEFLATYESMEVARTLHECTPSRVVADTLVSFSARK